MADLIFYTNPQSRGRIVRWMLEEVGQPYDTEIIAYDRDEGRALSGGQSDGQGAGDQAPRSHRDRSARPSAPISPTSFPQAGLGPRDDEKADYYRWLFYAAGPVEAGGHQPFREVGAGAGARPHVRLRQLRHASSRSSTSSSRCAIMSAAIASPPPTSMSARQIMWGRSSARSRSATASAAMSDRLKARDAFQRAGRRTTKRLRKFRRPSRSRPDQRGGRSSQRMIASTTCACSSSAECPPRGDPMPLREARTAAGRCRMLRDEYGVAPPRRLLSVVAWRRGRQALGDEVARVLANDFRPTLLKIIAVRGSELEARAERRPPELGEDALEVIHRLLPRLEPAGSGGVPFFAIALTMSL